jgi:hypothetical protein
MARTGPQRARCGTWSEKQIPRQEHDDRVESDGVGAGGRRKKACNRFSVIVNYNTDARARG